MSPITTQRHSDILIVTSNNPPVNALGHAVREGLVKAMDEADADETVKAVVVICEGNTFFAGADISEFGKPMQMPMLPMVVERIEACTKRSDARRGGEECVSTCRSRWSPDSEKKYTKQHQRG